MPYFYRESKIGFIEGFSEIRLLKFILKGITYLKNNPFAKENFKSL